MRLDGQAFKIGMFLSAALVLAGAHSAWGADTHPVLELGINFHAGDTGTSITGANGYFLGFRSEDKHGFFRPDMALKLDFASGRASVGDDEPNFQLFGASFLAGVNLFPFSDGKFLPFVGAFGVLGWNLMKLGNPPAGTEPHTKGLSFGFEINAGVDLRLGSAKGSSYRIRGGYWSVTSGLAGISGFQLSGFEFALGIVF